MTTTNATVVPARIAFDAGGLPFAADYGDVYHSADGGPAQARHVFLAGNDLPQRWRGREHFAILETGFGLGLNFLCTATAYLADPQAAARLHFVSVEKHPPRAYDLERAHAHWPEFAALSTDLRRLWPPALRGFHRLALAEGRITLTLLFGEAEVMLAELAPDCIDACYLDGFAPEKNPQMWSAEVFAQIARVCRADATAATWSVAAMVRSGLQSAGFALSRRPGFGRKRDMLTAHRTDPAPPTAHRERHAIVVGAGVSGCWTAHALARRGWRVDLIERRPAPAEEASGNPVGVLLPALNLADNENARLARAAFLHASRTLNESWTTNGLFARTGLLHVALERVSTVGTAENARQRSHAEQVARMQQILARHAFPEDFVRWVDTEEGSHLAGAIVGGPGWWIPAGGWVRPPALCDALLTACGTRLQARFNSDVRRIDRASCGWQVLDASGRVIAEAPTVVFANAHAAADLRLPSLPRLIAVRGQITYLPPDVDRRLDCIVCGDGYAAPLSDGGLCVGATFEPGSTALDLRTEDHELNLRRANRMLPGSVRGIEASRLTGRAALRTATADRLPACGELEAQPTGTSDAAGLHLLAGLGARGLIWAPLCAEVLASRLEGEPNPVEASLIHAMRPSRDPASNPL